MYSDYRRLIVQWDAKPGCYYIPNVRAVDWARLWIKRGINLPELIEFYLRRGNLINKIHTGFSRLT